MLIISDTDAMLANPLAKRGAHIQTRRAFAARLVDHQQPTDGHLAEGEDHQEKIEDVPTPVIVHEEVPERQVTWQGKTVE